MWFVEILALCGITQIITTSRLFAPLRNHIPTTQLKYMISCPQDMGFSVGFAAYAAVALSAALSPEISFAFPLAASVAATANVYAQWGLVLLLGGLISICAVLVNHIIELLFYMKMWFIMTMNNNKIQRLFQSSTP